MRRAGWPCAAALVVAALGAGCTRTVRGAPRPPAAALVDVREVAPDVRLDLRYATPENFTGVAVYAVARCLLRPEVAERLARVQRRLLLEGLGLRVWDCYRPLSVQERFWVLVPDERYVARPERDASGRPVAGSKHNRGAAVDVTLVDGSGRPLAMPTAFDDFTAAAHRGSGAGGPVAQANARRLEAAMAAEGFQPLPTEWWHFDGPGWQDDELLDVPLDAHMRKTP